MVAMPAAIASCGLANWQRLAVDRDLARVGPMHAAENADQRRFAGAVLADQRVDFARHHVEIDAVERARRAEAAWQCRERWPPEWSCAGTRV